MSQIFKPEASSPPPPGFVEFLEGNDSVPVGPNGADIIFTKATVVPAGTTPFTTVGNAGTFTETWEIQLSQAIAATDATKVGFSAFNSADFTVDANGFVSLVGGASISKVGVDTSTPPGTNPVLPNASGEITVTGGQVAAGTTTNVIRTDSLAANTYTIQVQRSQAVASSTVGDNGVSHFNSSFFTVDANGFVGVSGTGLGQTITGQTGGALSPTAGNWNIFGDGVTGSGYSTAGNILTSGTGSTLTISPSQAQFMTNYTQVLVGASPYTALATDHYISAVSSGGAISILLPNAPTTNRLFIIKDKSGDASVNNISITTVGGAVTIDGQTTYTLAGNYGAVQLLFNGTSYEVY